MFPKHLDSEYEELERVSSQRLRLIVYLERVAEAAGRIPRPGGTLYDDEERDARWVALRDAILALDDERKKQSQH